MTVYKKNEGSYIPYELSGTRLSLQNSALTLDLSELQRDDPIHLDISADASGRLVTGPSHRYVAEVELPARAYTIEKGVFDDFGFPQLFKRAAPLDPDQVTLTLWSVDVKSATDLNSAKEGS
jgi:hypothetical protein